MIYSLDIETAAFRAEEYVENKKYSAPKNWKDPDKIAAKIDDQRQADVKKAALHWWTGKVICTSVTDVISGQSQSFYCLEEIDLLVDLITYLNGKMGNTFGYHIIGKNVNEFDLPFIRGRLMYHNLGLPTWLRQNNRIEEIDHCFSRSKSSAQVGKLSDYAFGLDIQGKIDDISGADVPAMYIDGQLEKIVEYCERDTQIVAEIYRRYEREWTDVNGR